MGKEPKQWKSLKETDLILFGASGHGKVIADIAKSIGLTIDKIWDDNPGKELNDYLVEKTPDFIPNDTELILSVGNNDTRKKLAVRFAQAKFQKLIHATVCVGTGVQIGEGTVVMPGAVINADTKIGRHVIINTNASVDHDCTLEDFVHISPNATLAGNVNIGNGTWVGAGSTIIQGLKIGKWVVVGAGTVVISDVPDNCTVVGNPARIIKKHETNL